jgi:phosphatidylglycerol:prolipoprotein diacylglycerol transferase
MVRATSTTLKARMPLDLTAPQVATHFSSLGLSPVLVELGPFVIRWYSLAYIAGILIAWWYLLRLLRGPNPPMGRLQADAFVTWATIGIILGGRLAYVIFYEPAKYLSDPLAILRLWEGGMSFHGGAAGVSLAIILFARAYGLSALRIHDYIACTVPFGLFFGRLANFVNGELWGRPTDVPWAIIFPAAGPEPRHPSQLYEAVLEGPVLFLILWWLMHRTSARNRPGHLLGAFLVGYGLFRFIAEFAREPDRQLGVLGWGLTMGQSLCVPMVVAGVWFLMAARRTVLPAAAGGVDGSTRSGGQGGRATGR